MDDLISRQQAIEIVERYNKSHMVLKQQPMLGAASIVIELEELPSAQPERPKGEWIHQSKFSRIECDQCGKVFRNSFAPKNFCPNCGADMRGEQE